MKKINFNSMTPEQKLKNALKNNKIKLINIINDDENNLEFNVKFGESLMKKSEFQILIEAMKSIETKVDNLETKVDNLETKVDNLETKVDNLETKVDNLETKVNNLETKVDEGFNELRKAVAELQDQACNNGWKINNRLSK